MCLEFSDLLVVLFELKFDNDLLTKVKTKMTGRARDMAHDGPDVHDQVVEQLQDKTKCMISR